ncbi:MAG: MFS transporter [Thermomicrobiales bacterium]
MRTPRDPSVFRRFSPTQLRNPWQEFHWPPRFSGGIMLALAGLAVFMSGPAQTYGVSAFVDPMLTELGESRSLFSTTYSIGTLVSALTLLIVGRQIDRYGSRLVMTLAAVVFAAALFCMSGVGGVLTLAIGFSLLRASGQGVLTLAARTLVPHWFVRRRGRAFSIIGLAATASLAVVPVFNESLIRHFGWRDAWRVNSVIILVVLAPLLWFFVRDRPETVGQHPDGIPPDPALPHHAGEEHGHTLKQAMRTPAFWALIGAGLVPSLVLTGLSFNQVAILTDRGLPATLAAATFTVESFVGLPITLMAGSLADRFPLRFTLAAGQAFLALAMLVLLVSTTRPWRSGMPPCVASPAASGPWRRMWPGPRTSGSAILGVSAGLVTRWASLAQRWGRFPLAWRTTCLADTTLPSSGCSFSPSGPASPSCWRKHRVRCWPPTRFSNAMPLTSPHPYV